MYPRRIRAPFFVFIGGGSSSGPGERYGVLRCDFRFEASGGCVDGFCMVDGDVKNAGVGVLAREDLPDEVDLLGAAEVETEDVGEEVVVLTVDGVAVFGDVEDDAEEGVHPAVKANVGAGGGLEAAAWDEFADEVVFEGLLEVAIDAEEGELGLDLPGVFDARRVLVENEGDGH